MARSPVAVALIAVSVVLTWSATVPAEAKVPGPNGRIVFAREDPTLGDTVTYTADADGSHVRRLFPGASGSPHWSPDGSRVAIGACADPPVCDTAAVIVNPASGAYRVLSMPQPARLFTGCTIWAPNGRRLVCEGQGQSDPRLNGLYTIRTDDGRGLTRITSNPGGDDIPIDFSPDGRRLVFSRTVPTRPSTPDGANQALFVVDVDGTNAHRITPWGLSDDDGSWSPDGTTIAFEHNGRLFTVHPNGTDLEPVALATGTRFYAAGDFSWSPDGSRIAFLLFTWNNDSGPFRQGIATAKANGRDVDWVTTSPTFDHEADWGAKPSRS